MFAKYLKQFHKVAFYRPPARNISFLKNLIKKEQPPPQPTPEEKPIINQEIPKPQESQKFEEEIPDLKEQQTFEQELTTHSKQEEYDSELPQPPKSRSTQLQEEVDKELDLPYKLYGSHVHIEPKVNHF